MLMAKNEPALFRHDCCFRAKVIRAPEVGAGKTSCHPVAETSSCVIAFHWPVVSRKCMILNSNSQTIS